MPNLTNLCTFDYLEHLVTLPVTAGGVETRFVLDSGIGLTLVSESLATRAGAAPIGTSFTGRRMSGQDVTVPLATLESLALGSLRRDELTVGVLDLDSPALREIGGFLSLAFFDETAVTVDYAAQTVSLDADPPGTPVDVRVERDGPSVVVFLPLELPNGRVVEVEVDMGSDVLILHERLARELGLDLEQARRVDGRDETGHEYTRWFTNLPGVVRAATAPSLAQQDPEVMLQEIVYDGLVGHDFLRNFAVTYDLPNGRMVFG